MNMEKINKEKALEILHSNMENQNLRRHCYAVGKALAAYHDYFKQIGVATGSLDKEIWETIGILHDADWEKTTNTPEQHTLMLLEWLKSYDIPQ